MDIYNGWSFAKINEEGHIIGIKCIATAIFKLKTPDGNDMKNQDGTPVYQVETQQTVRIFTPEEFNKCVKEALKKE